MEPSRLELLVRRTSPSSRLWIDATRDSAERNACQLTKHISLEAKLLIAILIERSLQSLSVFSKRITLQLCFDSLLSLQESESTV